MHPKFVDKNQASNSTATQRGRPIMEMPEIFDQLFRKQLTINFSKLKYFFKSFLLLIHDKDDVTELTALIEETLEEM